MNDTLALTPLRTVRPPRLAEAPRRLLTIPPGVIATWRERIRVRWELAQMAKDSPHLVDDIGLTRRQLEAEIAKPFWKR